MAPDIVGDGRALCKGRREMSPLPRGMLRSASGRAYVFIMNRPLDRRTFLRGSGVALGLPLLQGMLPRSARAVASTHVSIQAEKSFVSRLSPVRCQSTSTGGRATTW